ncbi:MAG TPA: CofH family radical SAM protein [Fibrobacteria bacterium]|nr:CofH family radical SAM protein [Fibrobacteria bacterium]
MQNLESIESKLSRAERLSPDDALWLYRSAPSDWLRLWADKTRQRLHGDAAFYNRNVHFEPTNKCIYACSFCAFARRPEEGPDTGAWDHELSDLQALLDAHPAPALTEVHITGGVHPDRGVEYGEALCSLVRDTRPEVHVKAFTAVEVAYFARKSGITVEQALERLKTAGLASLPGGGAEIFDPEVRKKIAGQKSPAHRWLEIHEIAHGLGIKSNATMLYGHVEEHRHRVDHMLRLRELQDRTGGFMAFIPLRYRNENNALSHLPEVSPEEDLRNFAVARLFLDNIPHLKAYWVMLGVPQARAALHWGVDDLDGTVDDTTRIYSMAGAEEKNPAMSSARLEEIIRAEGRVPMERDSLYRQVALRSD